MASVVQNLGYGGQRFAEQTLGWCRATIRKGLHELQSGQECLSRFTHRGRKKAEHALPSLLDDIRSIVEPTGQTDPTFRSTRTYTPITAASVRQRLIQDHSYRDADLPCVRTISTKLSDLNFRPMKVKKCRPLKKIPETDAIFDHVHRRNQEADDDCGILRISLDSKAVVNVGAFSRGGKSRQGGKAFDHDFAPENKLTPFGILLPQFGESFLWFTEGKATADFMIDRLEEIWPKLDSKYRPHTLMINADNGPECSGRRTQWLKRLFEFSQATGTTIELAYYPPYHSKYNPVERLWGVLENHWRGELLESIEKILGLARTMTYRSIKPVVKFVKKTYESGVSLSRQEMQELESKLERKAGLEQWFIRIPA